MCCRCGVDESWVAGLTAGLAISAEAAHHSLWPETSALPKMAILSGVFFPVEHHSNLASLHMRSMSWSPPGSWNQGECPVEESHQEWHQGGKSRQEELKSWGYPQIINFRLGCSIINHPFLGCRKPADFLAGHWLWIFLLWRRTRLYVRWTWMGERDGLVTALTRVLLFHVDSSGIRIRSMRVLNPQIPCICINPRIQLFCWI